MYRISNVQSIVKLITGVPYIQCPINCKVNYTVSHTVYPMSNQWRSLFTGACIQCSIKGKVYLQATIRELVTQMFNSCQWQCPSTEGFLYKQCSWWGSGLVHLSWSNLALELLCCQSILLSIERHIVVRGWILVLAGEVQRSLEFALAICWWSWKMQAWWEIAAALR